MTARKFIKSVGSASIEKAVAVGEKSVSAAYTADKFPASWFDALDALATEKKVTLDRSCFNWKRGEVSA